MEALTLAGIPMGQTYEIIKAISKKNFEVINSYKDVFIEGFANRIMKEQDKEEIDVQF